MQVFYLIQKSVLLYYSCSAQSRYTNLNNIMFHSAAIILMNITINSLAFFNFILLIEIFSLCLLLFKFLSFELLIVALCLLKNCQLMKFNWWKKIFFTFSAMIPGIITKILVPFGECRWAFFNFLDNIFKS